MEISYGLVNLMYFMLCGELSRIKGSRSNKRRKLLTCFTNSLFKVYNNLSLRETGPEVYNTVSFNDHLISTFAESPGLERFAYMSAKICKKNVLVKFNCCVEFIGQQRQIKSRYFEMYPLIKNVYDG